MDLIIDNKKVKVKREEWPVERLKLDAQNPRLNYTIQYQLKGKLVHDQDLHRLLWEMKPVRALADAIYTNGGLTEDPIVRTDGTVVEGNCRTVSLRELCKKYPDDGRFAKLHVQILPDDVSERQLQYLLGSIHIAGKIEWRAYDQAEYVWSMVKLYKESLADLAVRLRWSQRKLKQKISAFESTRTYLQKYRDPQGASRFSFFEELVKQSDLVKRAEEDKDFIEQFSKWVLAGKLKDAKDARVLPNILENPEALEALERSGIDAARSVIYREDPGLGSNLYAAVDRMCAEIETIDLAEISAIRNRDSSKMNKLSRLKSLITELEKRSGVSFE